MKIAPETITHFHCECGEPLGSMRCGKFRAGGLNFPQSVTAECARCGRTQRWTPKEFFLVEAKNVASGKDSAYKQEDVSNSA